MADGLWWLPSLLVFGAAGAVLALAVVGARRLGRRRERSDLAAGRAGEVRAKGLIVQADERLREARGEVAFAEAQFGAEAAAGLRDAVARAERWLREAFLLQQRLDDAESDTAAERRSWSSRIASLCESVLHALDEAEAGVSARRAAERGAGATLAELRETAARLARRRADAAAALGRLGTRFAPTALVGGRAALERIDVALGAAEAVLGGAAGDPGAAAGAAVDADAAPGSAGTAAGSAGTAGGAGRRGPADAPGSRASDAERAARAEAQLGHAARDLDQLDRLELELAEAQRAAAESLRRLDAELLAARDQRDALDDAAAAAELGSVIAELSAQVQGVASRAAGGADTTDAAGTDAGSGAAPLTDPLTDRDRTRAALDRLESARAEARTSQDRLDGARSALGGALAIAESQIGVARSLIERGRGAVGADARTRLAEAERQLVIARQEPDPVAALDAARRATARAADAEALAYWDAGAGR